MMTKKSPSEIFNYSPQIEDLINFAQHSAVISAPTNQGELPVYIDILWEGEMLDITKKSAVVCNVMDEASRSEYIKLETLVYAINRIGDEEYKSEDPDINKGLKDKLRIVLSKSSSLLVDFLYEMYELLLNQRNTLINEKLEDIKKKNLERLMEVNPL